MAHTHSHAHGHGHAHGSLEEGAGEIRRIAKIGVIRTIFLSILQLAVGYTAGSLALITDGLHTLSDMISDMAVMIGVHFGSKKPDFEHPWGHGRMETFIAAAISFLLMAVGAAMIYKSIMSIHHGYRASPNWAVLVVALACVFSTEVLYRMAKTVAKKTNSTVLYASAWHHRSDSLSSIAVILGWIGLKAGFGYGDQIAAIVVGIMIVVVGVRIFNECLAEFSERAVDEEILSKIDEIVRSHEKIRQYHKLRTRTVGREIFLDLHILVDPALTIGQGHTIAEDLEEHLHHDIHLPINIIIHVEPDTPEIREIVKNL